jgi:hypothetical protein
MFYESLNDEDMMFAAAGIGDLSTLICCIVKMENNHSFSIHGRHNGYMTLLDYACKGGHVNIVNYLIEKGMKCLCFVVINQRL